MDREINMGGEILRDGKILREWEKKREEEINLGRGNKHGRCKGRENIKGMKKKQ